jgi:hypothetical protein
LTVRRSNPGRGNICFFFQNLTGCGAQPASCLIHARGKPASSDADHCAPPDVSVKNAWSYATTAHVVSYRSVTAWSTLVNVLTGSDTFLERFQRNFAKMHRFDFVCLSVCLPLCTNRKQLGGFLRYLMLRSFKLKCIETL